MARNPGKLHQTASSYVQADDVEGLRPLLRRHWCEFGQDRLDELLKLGRVVGEGAVLEANQQTAREAMLRAFCDDRDLPAPVLGPVGCCALHLFPSSCAADVMHPPSAERTQLRVSRRRRYRLCLGRPRAAGALTSPRERASSRAGDLEAGDEVVLTLDGGESLSYRVTGIHQVPKNDFPTEAVYAHTPGPTLRLITCGGPFDRTPRHYRDNTIVFADLS